MAVLKRYTGSEWEVVGAAQSGSTVFASYTPTLTQSGAVTKTVDTARYCENGKLVTVWVRLSITGSGTAANALVAGLPVTAAASNLTIGHGLFFDSSLGDQWMVRVAQASTTTVVFTAATDAGDGGSIGANTPMALAVASGDILSFFVTYEAA